MKADRKLVVVCAGTSWSGITGSDHQIAKALARFFDILWVDPSQSPLRGGRPWPRLETIGTRMTRLTTAGIPGHMRPSLNRVSAGLQQTQIRWALGRLSRRPSAVIACMLDDVLSGWPSDVRRVFYGTDDFVAGAELMGLDSGMVATNERRQLANADVVVAISPALAERWSRLGAKQTELIPNGVLSEAFSDLATNEPAADVRLAAPVAGVVGQLSARIDIGLLEAVQESGTSLLLVGPHDPRWEPDRFAALCRRPNVRWVGQKTFGELPGYYRHMDVGLTPYARTEFNRASFPLKTLEYLAAGLPAVSTDLPATRWLASDLIRIASTPQTFARAVAEAAAERTNPSRERLRQEFAATHSWDQRAIAFARAMGLPARELQEALA